MAKNSSNKKWTGAGKGSGLGHKAFIFLINIAGATPAYILLFPVTLFYLLIDKAGRNGIKSFYKNLPNTKPTLRNIYRNYYYFGMSLVDRVIFLTLKKIPFKYEYINEEYISKALEPKKGAILLSAHIGNWDVAGNLLKDRLSVPINAVMFQNEKEGIKESLQDVESKRKFKIIPIKTDSPETMIAIRNALSKNELVCLHGDRSVDAAGVEVNFLGEKALFPNGAFSIAAVTDCPIIPVFITKKGFGNYKFRAFDPIYIKPKSREQRATAIKSGLVEFVSILEHVSKESPSQWFNFYKFWN